MCARGESDHGMIYGRTSTMHFMIKQTYMYVRVMEKFSAKTGRGTEKAQLKGQRGWFVLVSSWYVHGYITSNAYISV